MSEQPKGAVSAQPLPSAEPAAPKPQPVAVSAPPKVAPFTARQKAHAQATGRPVSRDVDDPTAADVLGHAPAGVKDEVTAIAHAKKYQVQTRVPGTDKFARVDGSVGAFQRP